MEPPDPESAILEAVASLRPGEYATYGEVAEMAGHPGRARLVGHVLAVTAEDVPWWRVVGAGGRIVSPSAEEQAALLMSEGHLVTGRRIRPDSGRN